MQIVIDIPEEDFENIKLVAEMQKKEAGLLIMPHSYMFIANGTPLPKGHGDLKDANALEECKEIMNTISGESKYAVRMDDARNIPSIIEADKEEAKE